MNQSIKKHLSSIKTKHVFILFGLVVLVFYLAYFSFSLRQLFFNQTKYLETRYPKGYTLKSVKIGDVFISFIFDTNLGSVASTDEVNYHNHPLIYATEPGGSVLQKYELAFDPSDNCTILPDSLRVVDVNQDGQNEILSQWSCSSGAHYRTGMVIWQVDSSQKLVPLVGFPVKSADAQMIITNLASKKQFAFSTMADDDYVDYQMTDAGLKLYMAQRQYTPQQECRNCPGKWELQVFSFKDGRFVPDKTWNNGRPYTPKKTYSPDQAGREVISKIFQSRFEVE